MMFAYMPFLIGEQQILSLLFGDFVTDPIATHVGVRGAALDKHLFC
jgi:hypothetical protein